MCRIVVELFNVLFCSLGFCLFVCMFGYFWEEAMFMCRMFDPELRQYGSIIEEKQLGF